MGTFAERRAQKTAKERPQRRKGGGKAIRRGAKGEVERAAQAQKHATYGKNRNEKALRLYGTPYTHGYGTAFDHEAFYSWAEQCPRPVIISEYAMPEDRFACVWERHTTIRMAAQGAQKKRIERMFVPRKQIGMWRILTGTLFFGDC